MKSAMYLNRFVIAVAACGWVLSVNAQEPSPGADVESLLAYARERNPEYAAMRYEAEAASERIGPAGALPDPVLRTELQNITNSGTDGSTSILPSRVGMGARGCAPLALPLLLDGNPAGGQRSSLPVAAVFLLAFCRGQGRRLRGRGDDHAERRVQFAGALVRLHAGDQSGEVAAAVAHLDAGVGTETGPGIRQSPGWAADLRGAVPSGGLRRAANEWLIGRVAYSRWDAGFGHPADPLS